MCFFKKKKANKPVINSQFKVGDPVRFRHKDELTFGWIYEIKLGPNGKVIYDIQVGGQCPAVLKDIPEEILKLRED